MDFGFGHDYGCGWGLSSTTPTVSVPKSMEAEHQPRYCEYGVAQTAVTVKCSSRPHKIVFDDDETWLIEGDEIVQRVRPACEETSSLKLSYKGFRESLRKWIEDRAPAQSVINHDLSDTQPIVTLNTDAVDPTSIQVREIAVIDDCSSTVDHFEDVWEERNNEIAHEFEEVPSSIDVIVSGAYQLLGFWSLGHKLEYAVSSENHFTYVLSVKNTWSGRRAVEMLGISHQSICDLINVMAKLENCESQWAVQLVNSWQWKVIRLLPRGDFRESLLRNVLTRLKVPPDRNPVVIALAEQFVT